MNYTVKRLLVVAVAVLLLSGCNGPTPNEAGELTPHTHGAFIQELPDGRAVICVWTKSGYSGGMSCDWESAK